MIVLNAGDLSLSLCPDVGGAVSAFTWNGIDLLRPAPGDTNGLDPRDMAAFPMVPFVGRIIDGEFSWRGHQVRLPANMPPEPHAIHGFGWQSGWDAISVEQRYATLRHSSEKTDWPWQYEAFQMFELEERTLKLSMQLINRSEKPMPAGLGWHPYFPSQNAKLYAHINSEARLPQSPKNSTQAVETAMIQLSNGGDVNALSIDTVFELSDHLLVAQWPTHTLSLKSDPPARFATIYSPPASDFFCAEPVTHIPGSHALTDPLSDTGLVELQPGEDMKLMIELHLRVNDP